MPAFIVGWLVIWLMSFTLTLGMESDKQAKNYVYPRTYSLRVFHCLKANLEHRYILAVA